MCAVSSRMVSEGSRVALADGEVVGVVRGRDLDGAGAELGFAQSSARMGISRLAAGGGAERQRMTVPMMCL